MAEHGIDIMREEIQKTPRKRLRIFFLCNGEEFSVFRVRNRNREDVVFTWELGEWKGRFSVRGGCEVRLYLPSLEREGERRAKVYVNGVFQSLAIGRYWKGCD